MSGILLAGVLWGIERQRVGRELYVVILEELVVGQLGLTPTSEERKVNLPSYSQLVV